MERIEQQPEHPDLQYLYFCVVTDFGLLNAVNAADRTEEQKIRNYFRQQNALRELTDFFRHSLKIYRNIMHCWNI